MALREMNGQSNKVFVSCANGKFVQRLAEPTHNSKTRTSKPDKDGQTHDVHEAFFNYVDGLIMDVRFESKDFQGDVINSLIVEVADPDGGPTTVVQMRDNSAYAVSFVSALANITDFAKPLSLFVWSMENKERPDRPFTGITIYSKPNDKTSKVAKKILSSVAFDKLDAAVRKDYLVMPDAEMVEVNGKEVLSKTKQIKFIKAYFSDNIEPRIKQARSLNAVLAANAPLGTDTAAVAVHGDAMEDPDDVPF